MSYKLKILPENEDVKQFYMNYETYYEGDSGIDLFFPTDITILPRETKLVDLMIKCELVDNDNNSLPYYLYPRSSISKTPLRMSNSVGIIDKNYRGNIKVSLDNISDNEYNICKGNRLFQICHPNLYNMKVILSDKLSETDRNENGFGSSGN